MRYRESAAKRGMDWIEYGVLSERRGCRLIQVSRSTVRYTAHRPGDSQTRGRLKAIAEQ